MLIGWFEEIVPSPNWFGIAPHFCKQNFISQYALGEENSFVFCAGKCASLHAFKNLKSCAIEISEKIIVENS